MKLSSSLTFRLTDVLSIFEVECGNLDHEFGLVSYGILPGLEDDEWGGDGEDEEYCLADVGANHVCPGLCDLQPLLLHECLPIYLEGSFDVNITNRNGELKLSRHSMTLSSLSN
ncbi:unnamed protein product [Sphagnum tenellum]